MKALSEILEHGEKKYPELGVGRYFEVEFGVEIIFRKDKSRCQIVGVALLMS